jgi:hypothetical protein
MEIQSTGDKDNRERLSYRPKRPDLALTQEHANQRNGP